MGCGLESTPIISLMKIRGMYGWLIFLLPWLLLSPSICFAVESNALYMQM